MKFSSSFVFVLLVVGALTLAKAATVENMDEVRVIELSEDVQMTVTRRELLALVEKGVTFRDVTDFPALVEEDLPVLADVPDYPKNLSQLAFVQQRLIPMISTDRIASTDRTLSNYFTRYYRSETGRSSSLAIFERLLNISEQYNYAAQISLVNSISFPQKSVIVTIVGSDDKLAHEFVVAGAHLDSIAGFITPATSRSPGADDDGSGTTVLLELFAILAEAEYVPARTLSLQFYAAEEVGLVGSAQIARAFRKTGVNVVGMLNCDMAGYPNADDQQCRIGVLRDTGSKGVNPQLSDFLQMVVAGYTECDTYDTKCNYACSDFASYTANGYPSAMPEESGNYKQIHTAQDLPENLDVNYASQFVRLALGFVVELTSDTF